MHVCLKKLDNDVKLVGHCQLPAEGFQFCSGTPPCVVQAPFWSCIHLRLGSEQSCWYCELGVRMSLGVFCFTTPRCAPAISVHEQQCTMKHIFSTIDQCLAAPPTNKQQNARNSYFGWSKRGTRGNPAEDEGRYNQWDEGKSHDSAKDNEGEAIEGRDKSRDCDGTEDVEGVAQAPKASDSALADATDVETIRSKLW